jgi:hypothetical protein
MDLNNDEIRTAMIILATYPVEEMRFSGDKKVAHKCLALIHKVKAHSETTSDTIIIPEIDLTLGD